MASEYRGGFNFRSYLVPVRWHLVLRCVALIMIFCTTLASAGVVKSKGVKRIVDGPQGEVVVDSVLDDNGIPLVEASPESFGLGSAPSQAPKTEKKPSIATNNNIQYKEPVVDPEDYEKKSNNGLLKLIIIGVLILGIGGGVVFYLNKRG